MPRREMKHAPRLDVEQRAVAVIFELKEPIGIIEGLAAELRRDLGKQRSDMANGRRESSSEELERPQDRKLRDHRSQRVR